MNSIDEEDVAAELPELPKGAADGAYASGSRRKSSVIGRRMSKIGGAGPRRESMGVQRLINDFMKAAGMDHTKNNVSSVADKRLEEVAPNFAPKHVRTYCQDKVSNGNPQLEPFAVETFAAVVMVDVSGYSKLSASLAEKGPIGSELLSKSMKGYLDQIIQTILIHGGDIVKFAGDAVIIYWRLEPESENIANDTVRGEIVLKAAQCCLDLLTRLGTYNIDIEDCSTKILRIHLGIGAGMIHEVHVGGGLGRWEFFIAGDGVNQLGSVLDLAKAGELAMSHQSLKYFSAVVDIDTVTIGSYDKKCIILTGLEKARRKIPQAKIVTVKERPLDSAQAARYQTLFRCFIDRTALFKIQADIRQSILFGMETKVGDLLNLIELRQVTTVFIRIGDLQKAKGDSILPESQKALQVVQNALYENQGALRQFHVDDKGAVILCFFGLPPLAHENDAGLGLKAAISIKNAFLNFFEEFSIGVTTGIVAFGGVGCDGRTEYAVMGDAINMAARLMCHPEAAENLLCDEKSYNLCRNDFEFKALGETKVKGKAHAIAIFRPVSELDEAARKKDEDSSVKRPIIGRISERSAIKSILAKMVNKDQSGILILEADGGQGLSTLYEYVRQEGAVRGCVFGCGVSTEIEQKTPYYCFRSILNDLFTLVEDSTVGEDGKLRLSSKATVAKATVEIAPWMNSEEDEVVPETVSVPSSPTKTGLQLFNEFTSSFKKKNALEMDKQQQPVAKAVVAEAASHVHSKKKTDSEELLYDDTQEEDKVDYAELQRRKQGEVNLLFAQRAMSALQKIGTKTNEASVLNLVMPSVFAEQDNTASMSRKIRLRELGELLKKIIGALTECNRLVICLKETQYMDSLSWELLWEVLLHCPKLTVFIFSRELHDYESESNRNIVTKIKGLPSASFITIDGLNLEETRQLILACWVGPKIKEVDDSIIVEIHKRSDGKPLYIRSLALSLKETGQFRILGDGTLTGLGKLDIGFSFDDRNIVISQFDRLNRTFQLFLKIAAVVGQVFLLEDVVYFLTGMPGIFEKIDTTNLNDLVAGVEGMDKYKYLQRRDDAVGFTFKSTVVRQFIYSLMVLQQREVLHARVAKHFEGKLTPESRYHLLIPIYEHYMQAGQKEQAKKIYYLEAIAEFHFENESMSEAVKAYNMLLDCIKTETNIDTENLAGWHRELGAAYLHLEDFEKAKDHLLECLRLQGYSLPPSGIKFDWELKKHLASRQKYEKTMCPGPMREDYVKSYNDFMGSGMVLTANSKGADDFRQRAPPKINLLKSLFGLAKIFAGMHEVKQLKLVLLIALNICEEMPKDGLYCQLMALYAVHTLHNEENASLAPKYIEMAETYDMRYAINESIDVVSASASLAFMLGNWAECKRKYDALLHLGTLANDYKSTSESLRCKCALFLFGNSRPSSIGLARELFNLATEQEDWEGQFWGSCLLMTNLLSLSEPEDVIELQRIVTRHEAVWIVATEVKKADPLYIVSRSAVLAHVAISRSKSANVSSILNNVASQFEQIHPEQQDLAFVACLNLYHTFVMLHLNNGIATDKALTAVINDICEAIHKMTKAGLHTSSLSADMKHLFKGFKAQVMKKTGDAQKAWITGALTEGKTDAIYIQGLFNACLAKFHDKKAESDKSLAQAKTLFNKVGAANELRKIWNF